MKFKISLALACLAASSLLLLSIAFHVRLWLAELLVSMTPQVVVVATGLLVVSLILFAAARHSPRKPGHTWQKSYVIITALSIASGLYCLDYSVTVQPVAAIVPATSTSTIRFASFNKLNSNTEYDEIATYIRQQNITVVAMQETPHDQLQAIADKLGLPYQISIPDTLAGVVPAVGIISQLPIKSTSLTPLGGGYGVVRTELTRPDGQSLAAYSVHITPPFTSDQFEYGNRHIATLAGLLAAENLPTIIGGDFNTTVFSPKLRQFSAATTDRIKPTTTERWPACSWYGYGPALCMRIDHIYAPRTAKLHSTTMSPPLGSDHRMVVVEISL